MSLFAIKPKSLNPAVSMLDRMPAPARKWNFDAEFLIGDLNSEAQKFHFFIKAIDKPQYEFQYIDINEYGFKHKVLTGIHMGDLGIEFLDDTTNRVLNFIDHYLLNSVPNKNVRFSQTGSLSTMERNGFDSAAIKPRAGVGNTIIQQIKINQYAGTNPDGTGRGRIRTWIFEEPQIVSFDLDKQATDIDDLSGFVIRFNFKNVVIEFDRNSYPDRPDSPLDGLLDVATAFTPADATLPRILLPVVRGQNPFAIGPLGGNVFSGVPGGQLVTTGIGLYDSVNYALAPQDPRGPVQQGRNDNISGQAPISITGTTVRTVPNILDQGSKLLKII